MTNSLAPTLLLAMPDLLDPNFHRSVVLLVHHDDEGSVGMVLNRPTEIRAVDLCETLGIPWSGGHDHIVHWGGPVQPNTGWVVSCGETLASAEAATALDREGHIHFAGSLDALRAVAQAPPDPLRLFLGYAGWGPGQLETELASGAWVTAPFDDDACLLVPEDELWNHAWRELGVDPATVVGTPGIH